MNQREKRTTSTNRQVKHGNLTICLWIPALLNSRMLDNGLTDSKYMLNCHKQSQLLFLIAKRITYAIFFDNNNQLHPIQQTGAV